MRNTGLDKAQAGIKIAGRNINNLRYADDTTLMAESEEELKSLLMKVKEESEKVGLKLNIVNVWQKPLQYCKVISLQLIKINEKKLKTSCHSKNKPKNLNIQKTKIMASGPITSWQIDGETMETVTDFILGGSKINADGDCGHEIKRCLLLGRKAMTSLGSILKSRDITLPTKVPLVKVMAFPVVRYGCENWT